MRDSAFGHTASARFDVVGEELFEVRILVRGRPIPQPRAKIGAKVMTGGKVIQRKWISKVKRDGVAVKHPIHAYKSAIERAFIDLAIATPALRTLIPLAVPVILVARFYFAVPSDGKRWPELDGFEPYTGAEDGDNLVKAPLDALTVPKLTKENRNRDQFGVLAPFFLLRDDRYVFAPLPSKLIATDGNERAELLFRWRSASCVKKPKARKA